MQSWSITTYFIFAWYQKVEYIWSSWNNESWQFIRTWFKANNNTSIEMEAMATSLYQNANFWCSRDINAWTKLFALFRIWSELRQDFFTNQSATWYNISINTKYTIKEDKNKLYVNWSLIRKATNWTFQSPYEMLLLCSNAWWDVTWLWNFFYWRLYHCKLRDNWTLIRDFYPVYRKSDSVIWLLDIVNKVFYTNQWSGSFTKWPDIN